MYGTFFGFSGNTLATSVTIALQRKYSINLVFRSYGTALIMLGICVFFGISNVKPKAKIQSKKVPLKDVIR